jgi:hypothetical protein
LKRPSLTVLLAFLAAAPLGAGPLADATTPTAQAPDADAVIRLQRRADDQEAAIGRLQAALDDLRSQGRTHDGAAEEAETGWARLKFHVNSDVRFDNQYDKNPTVPLGGSGSSPDYTPAQPPSGSSGFFFKHVDLKFTYHLDESTVAYLHYNLAALELDKVGIEFRDLALPPFTSGWPGWTYNLFVGQRRQYFGIEPQTDSEDIYFPNRAMMYGGSTPFGNARTKANDPFNFYDLPNLAINNLVPQLVYDKVTGVHVFQRHDLGFLAYELGFDLVNDEMEASFDGGGTDSLKTGFLYQVSDQDLSEIGRLGLEPRALNDLLPWGLALKAGFSAFHDPENTAYLTSQASKQNWADTVGWDGRLSSDRDVLAVQGEWTRRQQFGPAYTGSGNSWTQANAYGGLAGSAEGWYVTVALQPWRLIDPKAPKLELLARYDTIAFLDQAPWLQSALTGAGGYTGSYNATTVALKYSYKGNCHTGIYFTTYGLANDFSATGPTQLIQLEQQVYY